MRAEFDTKQLNERGVACAATVGELFSDLLDQLELIVPAGRERALVVTKLQEAKHFAVRGVAVDPSNQREGA